MLNDFIWIDDDHEEETLEDLLARDGEEDEYVMEYDSEFYEVVV
jgi:hypothetical protein